MNEYDEWSFSPWRVVRWVGGIFAVLFALSIALWVFGVWTAPWYGRGEAHKTINSAPYRISAYDHFFEMCGSIQGLEGQIDELTIQANDATLADRTHDLAVTSLTGVKAARHQAIAKYNADARRDYTIGQFRDSDLPYQIHDSNYPDEGGKTSCGAN